MSSRHTNVISEVVPFGWSLARACREKFGQYRSDGSTPIVLVPRPRSNIFGWFFLIPSGVHAIVQRNGRYVGEHTPGLAFAPPWYRVAYLISMQSTTFIAPTISSPTSDNVYVSVDMTLVFKIVQAEEFVFKLGAQNFDDFLKASTEESIRAHLRTIPHTQIYELRGSGAEQILVELNSRFNEFGVVFSSATITGVQMPADLSNALSSATTFDSKMREQIRAQEFKIKLMNDNNDKALKDIELKNEREYAQEVSKKERYVIDLDKLKYEAERSKTVAIIESTQQASVAKKEAEAAQVTKKLEAQRNVEVMVRREQAAAAAAMVEADQWARNEITKTEGELATAKAKATALITEAEAEERAVLELKEKRHFDVEMERLRILREVASKQKMMMSGKNAEALFDSLVSDVVSPA